MSNDLASWLRIGDALRLPHGHALEKLIYASTKSNASCRRTTRAATTGIVVTRMVDASGYVSFAGTMYRAGRSWRGKEVEVSIVADLLHADGGAVLRALVDERGISAHPWTGGGQSLNHRLV